MDLEEFNSFPRQNQQDIRDEWKDIVAGAKNALEEALNEFTHNEIQLTTLAETKLLPTLNHYADDWKSPLNDFVLPDEWVHAFVRDAVIPKLRENIADGIMKYSSNAALVNHPNIAEATELYKETGTFEGRERIVQLILDAKIAREKKLNG